MAKSVARLIVTYDCLKDCAGCCNKNWKYDPPTQIQRLDYEQILITGGEPMLFPIRLLALVDGLRYLTTARIYIYTALITPFFARIANNVDGITLTLHDLSDCARFDTFVADYDFWINRYSGSLRLNIFPEADQPYKIPQNFKVKYTDWIIDCPLPKTEEFLRLKELWRLVD